MRELDVKEGWSLDQGGSKLNHAGQYSRFKNGDDELMISIDEDEDYYEYAEGSKKTYEVHYINDEKDIFELVFLTYEKDMAFSLMEEMMNSENIEKFLEN